LPVMDVVVIMDVGTAATPSSLAPVDQRRPL
jgi:hypothetical protein